MRKLTFADVPEWLALVRSVNWNQTSFDLEWLIRNAPDRVLGIHDDGRLIATAAAAVYADGTSCINMVIVDGPYRGRGYAKQLMLALIDSLGPPRDNITLQATLDGKPVYEKLGFKTEYGQEKWTGEADRIAAAGETDGIEPMTEAALDEAAALDASATGWSRRNLLEGFRRTFPDLAFQARRDGKLTGFVLGRQGFRYRHISPLEAADERTARALLARAAAVRPGELILDVPDAQAGLKAMLAEKGFQATRPLASMRLDAIRRPPDFSRYFVGCGGEFL